MQIQDALARFVRQLEANGRSPHTIAQFRRHLEQLARWAALGRLHEDVRSINHEALARFLSSPEATRRADGVPKKAPTVNAIRSSLRGFFRYLHGAGLVAEDPSRLIRSAVCGPPLPRTLSEPDQKRLLASLAAAKDLAGHRDHALFALLLGTGIRLGAALALDARDLDLAAGELVLRRSKGGRIERVFLPPALQRHLRAFLAGRTEGPLFVNANGSPITDRHARRRLANWLVSAGARNASPHALRHSFAMRLYGRTRDLLLVRRALGHLSIGSTLRYAQAQDEDLRAAMGLGA